MPVLHWFKPTVLFVALVAALSLTACGGSGGSSASDAPTSTLAPSYELVGNVLSVTNSGILDADGVTNLLYVLKNSAGQEVARQNSPRFADLTAGSYTLSTEGRAKNGATGASVAVINAKRASVVVLDTTAPTITITGPKVITLTQGDTFVMPRVTASDTTDGVVEVKIEGSIDTTKVGTQTLKLTAVDKAGNVGSDTISVTVKAKEIIDDVAPSKVSEYLDGLESAGYAGVGTITLSEAVDRVTGYRYVDSDWKNLIGFVGIPNSAPGALTVMIDPSDAKKLIVSYTVPMWTTGTPTRIEVDVSDKAGNTATIVTQGYNVN